jgi:hypothetical protein
MISHYQKKKKKRADLFFPTSPIKLGHFIALFQVTKVIFKSACSFLFEGLYYICTVLDYAIQIFLGLNAHLHFEEVITQSLFKDLCRKRGV